MGVGMVGKEGVKYKPAVIKFIGLKGIPIVKKGANIPSLIVKAARENGVTIEDGDIIIITHKIISKAEGRVINLLRVKPSKIAKAFASELGKDPKLVEVVLREAKGIVRMGNGHLITETKHGFIAAHSGVDLSNVDGGSSAVLLPLNPDESARRIREEIKRLTGRDIAVI
ncbi:F420-0--gamma-glutamyl ligase, partial [Candidatus Geothermarchaeota archaeon]